MCVDRLLLIGVVSDWLVLVCVLEKLFIVFGSTLVLRGACDVLSLILIDSVCLAPSVSPGLSCFFRETCIPGADARLVRLG